MNLVSEDFCADGDRGLAFVVGKNEDGKRERFLKLLGHVTYLRGLFTSNMSELTSAVTTHHHDGVLVVFIRWLWLEHKNRIFQDLLRGKT